MYPVDNILINVSSCCLAEDGTLARWEAGWGASNEESCRKPETTGVYINPL
jgi:hypothetical protein